MTFQNVFPNKFDLDFLWSETKLALLLLLYLKKVLKIFLVYSENIMIQFLWTF